MVVELPNDPTEECVYPEIPRPNDSNGFFGWCGSKRYHTNIRQSMVVGLRITIYTKFESSATSRVKNMGIFWKDYRQETTNKWHPMAGTHDVKSTREWGPFFRRLARIWPFSGLHLKSNRRLILQFYISVCFYLYFMSKVCQNLSPIDKVDI